MRLDTISSPHGRVLTIAGSDSGAGAGIQADLKTIAALGGWGMSAIAAVTAQNTRGVGAVQVLPAAMVRAQIDAVAEDIGLDAIKVGMLGSAANVAAVADWLRARPRPLVLDTVLRSSSGAALADAATGAALRDALLPLAALVTPNLDEAAALLGCAPLRTRAAMSDAAHALLGLGCRAVLLKGGHLDTAVLADLYVDRDGTRRWFEHPRLVTRNLHGTGCTLSAAIATRLAQQSPLADAIEAGIVYTQAAIRSARHWKIGEGCGPLAHFHPPSAAGP